MRSNQLFSQLKSYNLEIASKFWDNPDNLGIMIFLDIEKILVKAAESNEDIKETLNKIKPFIKKIYGLNGDDCISLDINNPEISKLAKKYIKFQTEHYRKMLKQNSKSYKKMLREVYKDGFEEYIDRRYGLVIELIDGVSGLIVFSGSLWKRKQAELKIRLARRIIMGYIEKLKEAEK